jgi:hypothetical protein
MQPSPARQSPLPIIAVSIAVMLLVIYWRRADLWPPPEPEPPPAATVKPAGAPSPGAEQRWTMPAPVSPAEPPAQPSPPATPPPGAPLQKSAAETLRFAALGNPDRSGGMRIYPGRNRVAFAQLGLRPGDHLISINGSPADGQTWDQLLKSLLPDSRISITVERNGRMLQLDSQAPDSAL